MGFFDVIGRDKLWHFSVFWFIGAVIAMLMFFVTSSFAVSFVVAMIGVVIIGAGKEFLDKLQGKRFSAEDLIADVIGGFVGSTLIALILSII